MRNLIIVESPTKARTLSKFLGNDYQIQATMGHVRDLPAKRLGIEIRGKDSKKQRSEDEKTQISQEKEIYGSQSYEFIPDYQVIPGRKKTIIELKKLASTSDKIILATDPDREGEAIAFHISELLKSTTSSTGTTGITGKKARGTRDTFVASGTFQRIVFHEITQSAIKEALLHPKTIDMQLVDSQQARRVLDRLVGYKLSPLLWNKLGMRWLSAGRVQSVAVRLIVEREREILAFIPVEYWMIEVELTSVQRLASSVQEDKESASFIARLVEIDAKKAEIGNKDTADKIVNDLKQANYKVDNVETKEVRRFPSPPFTTSSLQQAAVNRFGWSAKRTMRTAQNLYEEGFITYHRTDSTNIAGEATKMVRNYIYNVFGKDFLPVNPKFYKTKSRVAQEAHEAIRPTHIKVLAPSDVRIMSEQKRSTDTVSPLPENLGRDSELLYSLIWKRFVACQMNEAAFDHTSISIKAQRYTDGLTAVSHSIYILKTTGQIMKFAGWLTVYGESRIKNPVRQAQGRQELGNKNNNGEDSQFDREGTNKYLPKLTVGESLQYLNIFPLQKFTEPPPRYNEASLIKTLEEKGIGRPSTYAPIISTIQDRKYVEKIERKFKPTDLGFAVTDFLVRHFPDIFDVSFTARMEEELDEIANGKLKWMGVINDFYNPFNSKLESVFQQADRVKLDLGTSDEKCPRCGSPLAVRLSKYGKFLACSAFPDCKFTKNILEKAGIPCPRCGGDIIVKKTRHGKQFYGCSNYPRCSAAFWKKEEIK